MTETLTVDDLTFEVVRSARRRTSEIGVERDGRLVVRAPVSVSGTALEQFARQKRAWVYEKLARQELLGGRPPAREFVSGEGFPYLGRSYRLLLVDHQDAALKLREGRFRLRRDAVKRARDYFVAWYTRTGQRWIANRAVPWAERLGVETVDVRVRDLGYRWGSCGVSGLNFHWAAVALPPAIVDYLIVHELAHLKHPDHGREFWGTVDRALPTARASKVWLGERGVDHVV